MKISRLSARMFVLFCVCALLASGVTYTVDAGYRKLYSLTIDESRVTGGQALQAVVTLNGAGSDGDVVVLLKSSDTAIAAVPESVTIPAGADRATFEVTTMSVSVPMPVTISASYVRSHVAQLTVLPDGPTLDSVTLNSTSLTDGSPIHGIVTLTAPAPPGGAVVFLSSDNLSAVIPAAITIPEGESGTTFRVEMNPASVPTSMSITATYEGATETATLEMPEAATHAASALTTGAQFYVAPNGSPGGNGSVNSPWDLQTALNHPSAVKPGDTIWLRSGTYGSGGRTVFTSKLTGTQAAPIVVRQYSNERATVNAGIRANGAYTWFWGFEITNTSAARDVTDLDKDRPVGLVLNGNGNKAINLIINNTGRAGIGFWSYVPTGYEGEIYGVIFWGNGIYDASTDSGNRGDAVYADIADPNPKLASFSDTISFRNFNAGLKPFSQWSDRHVNGLYLSGNVAFDNGRGADISIVNSSKGISGLKLIGNYTYQRSTERRNSTQFGTLSGINNLDAVIQDNYFVAGTIGFGALFVNRFSNLKVTGNTIISPSILNTWTPSSLSSLVWDNNTYYGSSGKSFRYLGISYNWAGWKSVTGLDRNSTYNVGYPSQNKVVVLPNRYEPGRAHIVVYNWLRKPTIDVDLSGILTPGAAYEIRDAQNYFGAPVVTGVYNGGTVSLPMNLTAVAPLIGNRHMNNVHTDMEFNAFVVLKRGQ